MDKFCQALLSAQPPDFATLAAAWSRTLPLLNELAVTPQDAIWHAEGDVAIHTAMVLAEARSIAAAEALADDGKLTLLLSAVLHDIGKPLTTRTRVINDVERIVSPRHAEAGRSWLALRLQELGLPTHVESGVITLTGFHHHPRRLVQDDAPAAAWRRLARQCPLRLVYHLEQADLRGRHCPDLPEQLEMIELFRLRCEELGLWAGGDPWGEWATAMEDAFRDRSGAFRRHALHAGIRAAEEGVIQSVEEAIARAWSLRDPAPDLTVLCGPSGSGKSHWIATHRAGATVISLDELRQEIAGKRSDQTMNGQILQAAKERLKAALRGGGSIVWDATSLRAEMRSWVLQLGFDYGAHVTLVALQTPLSTLHSRNRKREHPIPISVLERQLETLEWPTASEAHELVVVRGG